ncbi:MAG: F0F1 ATP synthase subunit B [Pseudomonadota bacterium]|nr:F0F1 ATP synthase subunit B [Pseudomonadota bacterium]
MNTPEFWVAVGFLILLAVLFKPAKKMIIASLDSRAEKIRSSLDEAEKLREEAQHVLADYQRKQREAAKEIEGLVANARSQAETMRCEAENSVKNALARREQVALEKISQKEADAIAEVRNLAVDMAIKASGELLERRLGQRQSQELIETAIRELPRNLQ